MAQYVVIVGGGPLGESLARSLLAESDLYEVTLVDRDPEVCDAIDRELGSVTVLGDGSRPAVLRRAGAERASVVVALTSDDADNLAICQAAKGLFKVERTVSLVHDAARRDLFNQLGVGLVISVTDLILKNIQERLPHPPLVYNRIFTGHTPGQTGTARLVTITVPPDAQAVGKPLGELTMPPGVFVVLVVQRQMPVQPSQDLVLTAGDEVMAVTLPDQEDALREELTRVRREWAEREERA